MSEYSQYLSPTEDIIEDARNGKMIVLVDAEDRENEGDLIIPSQMATPEAINFMAKFGRGLICMAMPQDRSDQLGLELMSQTNRSRHQTAFTVSIEARGVDAAGMSQGRAGLLLGFSVPQLRVRIRRRQEFLSIGAEANGGDRILVRDRVAERFAGLGVPQLRRASRGGEHILAVGAVVDVRHGAGVFQGSRARKGPVLEGHQGDQARLGRGVLRIPGQGAREIGHGGGLHPLVGKARAFIEVGDGQGADGAALLVPRFLLVPLRDRLLLDGEFLAFDSLVALDLGVRLRGARALLVLHGALLVLLGDGRCVVDFPKRVWNVRAGLQCLPLLLLVPGCSGS